MIYDLLGIGLVLLCVGSYVALVIHAVNRQERLQRERERVWQLENELNHLHCKIHDMRVGALEAVKWLKGVIEEAGRSSTRTTG